MKPVRCLSALLLLASMPAFAGQVKTEDEAIKLTTDAIHKFHLTSLKDKCLLIGEVREKPSHFEVVVRENHTQSCGGDPETGPRLFNVRVRKSDGRLTSDVYDTARYRLLDHRRPSK